MKEHLKGAWKIFLSYIITVFVFLFFCYPFLNHLRIYSFVVFLLMLITLYSEMSYHATKEKRPQYNLKPYPLKGLVLGLLANVPLFAVQVIYPFVNISSKTINFENLKHLVRNVLFGPMFFLVKLGNETELTYYLCLLVVPVIAMLGYMSGYFGFDIQFYIRKIYRPENKGKEKGRADERK